MEQKRPWFADWQVFLVGAVALTIIWRVESWRKGGEPMWYWPKVPLALWLVGGVGFLAYQWIRARRSSG